jgi:transposase
MCAASARKPYPSDVSDEEWSLVVGYLTLMKEDAPQREYPLRELFNALRYVIRYGIAWRAMPNDLPPWHAVHQQAHRWLAAGCFEALAQDLRAVLRLAAGRKEEPTAAIMDSRTLRSTPESGTRAGYDGAKRKRGSKVHMAVDTLGHLLALHVTAADVGDREAVGRWPPISRMRQVTRYPSPMSIKAILARQRRRQPQPKGSSLRWSSCLRPSEASFCCPDVGLWRGPSPGLRVVEGS